MRVEAGTALVGATLIDATGSAPLADAAVVVAEDRITWAGPAAELTAGPGVHIIDTTGGFVMPGLMDANVHLVLQCDPDVLLQYEPGRYDELVLEAAQFALRAGITTVFDTWGPLEALRRVRGSINRGDATGSRIFLAGNIIGNDGPWSADFFPYDKKLNPVITRKVNQHWEQGVGAALTWMPAAQVREAVRTYIETSGIDFVKYASSAHAQQRFLAFSPAVQTAIVEEAHAAGLRAQACACTPEALRMAIDAGVDLLQHGNSTGVYPIPDDTLELIIARDLPCVVMVYRDSYTEAFSRDANLPEHAPDNWKQTARTKTVNAHRLIEAGARIVHATDGGVFGKTVASSPWFGAMLRIPEAPIRLGLSHVSWHQAVVAQGMSPLAALQAATRNVAEAYGVDDELGTVEPGKRADLLVLDANPLDDPQNYGRIAHVMKDGVLVDRSALPQRPVLTRGER